MKPVQYPPVHEADHGEKRIGQGAEKRKPGKKKQ
jgi:hypothetical protein